MKNKNRYPKPILINHHYINQLIEEKGITCADLSKDTGLPYNNLKAILNGVTRSPQFYNVVLIMRYFNIDDIEELVIEE